MHAQEKLVACTIARKLKHAPTSVSAPFSAAPILSILPKTIPASTLASDDVSALTHVFLSPAEQTMQRYQPPLLAGPPCLSCQLDNQLQEPISHGIQRLHVLWMD